MNEFIEKFAFQDLNQTNILGFMSIQHLMIDTKPTS